MPLKEALLQKCKEYNRILSFVTQYRPTVPNLKTNTHAKMAFNPATTATWRNISRSPDRFIQKGQILKRYTRSSQTLIWLEHVDRSCVGLSAHCYRPSKMTYSRKKLEIGLDQLLCIKMLIILKIKTRRMHCRVKYKHAEFCFWNTRECRKCREYLLAVSECFSYFSIIRKNFQMLILLNIKQSFREII